MNFMEIVREGFDAVISSSGSSTFILIKHSKIYKAEDGIDSYVDLVLEDDYDNNCKIYTVNTFKDGSSDSVLEGFYRSDRRVYQFADEAIEKYNEIVKKIEKIN